MSNKQPINVGDHVRWLNTGGYAGVVRSKHTVLHVELDETIDAIPEDALELAPAPQPKLTPEEAWAQASLVVIKYLGLGQLFLTAFDRRRIRHDIYVLLGGSGVKVTKDVKRQVVKIVRDVAEVVKVTILEPEED